MNELRTNPPQGTDAPPNRRALQPVGGSLKNGVYLGHSFIPSFVIFPRVECLRCEAASKEARPWQIK